MTMARLDQEIKRREYILECLMTLRDIYNTGDCNICAKQKGCKYAPKPGEMVGYNCPFYEAENEKEVHFVAAWQEDLEPHTVKSEDQVNDETT